MFPFPPFETSAKTTSQMELGTLQHQTLTGFKINLPLQIQLSMALATAGLSTTCSILVQELWQMFSHCQVMNGFNAKAFSTTHPSNVLLFNSQ